VTDHPLRDITPWRTVEPDVRANSVLKIFRGWLKECDEHHECSQQGPSILPTRLLDIHPSKGVNVRLIESRSLTNVRYIALSHCWGSGRPLVLTRALYHRFRNRINILDMPATFRDAVELCRRLKVRYLWIDSLCIIQDDVQDWAREARAMASVYTGAYLTISASLSASDSEGFLWERPIDDLVTTIGMFNQEGCVSDIAVQMCDSYKEGLNTRNLVSGVRSVADTEPISLRAWTMQERFLSRRKLLFCHDQVFWECQQHTRSENGITFPTYDFRVDNLWTQRAGYQEWYRLLGDYSQCAITYESDVLPALSGLVQEVSQMSPLASYCAGIWLDDISKALAWCVRRGDMGMIAKFPWETRSYRILNWGHCKRKTEQYQAPSFSWASWRGGVYHWYAFREVELGEDEVTYDEMYGRYKGKLWTYVHYVSHCLVPTPGADPLNGPFKDGWLRLRGCLLPVCTTTLNVESHRDSRSVRPVTFTCYLGPDKVVACGGLDNQEYNKARHDIQALYLLPLHTDAYLQWTTNFLVLERSDRVVNGLSALSRVGVGSTRIEYEDYDRKLLPKLAREAALIQKFDEFEGRPRFRRLHEAEETVIEALYGHPQEDIILI
jgi:hypothetical protein